MAVAAPLAIPLLIGSTALTAGSQLMAAQEKSQAAAFERDQQLRQQEALKVQEENTRIAATQAEARRREDLVSNMETIDALRAGRGVGEGSPTGRAILDSVVDNASRDIGTERFNYLTKADQYSQAAASAGLTAQMADRKRKSSMMAGYVQAAGTVMGGAYTASGGVPKSAGA